jgi:hypothetical protein
VARIVITQEAMDAIASAVTPGHEFDRRGTQRPDGSWEVPIGDDLLKRLLKQVQTGETLSDVIVRAINAAQGRKPN